MDQLETYKKVDTGKAWRQVHRRLQDDGLLNGEEETSGLTKGSVITRPLLYAASILLLIAAGGIGYFFFQAGSSDLLTLETGSGDNTFVQTFGDGSIAYLAGNSILRYPEEFKGSERKVYLSGEAFFDVQGQDGRPFVVATDRVVIEVLGTAFNLKSTESEFELIVEEGLVSITLIDFPGRSEMIGEWEMARGLGNRIETLPVVDRTYLSWRINKMQFRDERLGNIALVISKNYGVEIDFQNDSIRDRRLSVTFHNNDLNTIADVIAFSLDLEYEMAPDSGILFREKR
jgi:ferric-dicitrate binding protein FerR (iron transport regulator)